MIRALSAIVLTFALSAALAVASPPAHSEDSPAPEVGPPDLRGPDDLEDVELASSRLLELLAAHVDPDIAEQVVEELMESGDDVPDELEGACPPDDSGDVDTASHTRQCDTDTDTDTTQEPEE